MKPTGTDAPHNLDENMKTLFMSVEKDGSCPRRYETLEEVQGAESNKHEPREFKFILVSAANEVVVVLGLVRRHADLYDGYQVLMRDPRSSSDVKGGGEWTIVDSENPTFILSGMSTDFGRYQKSLVDGTTLSSLLGMPVEIR